MRTQLRTVIADRNAAVDCIRRQAAELDALRAEHVKLRDRLDRVCRTPVQTDGLSERMLHLVDLAQQEAHDIVADAQARAQRWHEELSQREAELEARRRELEAEHRTRVDRFDADAAAEQERAERRRREADEKSTRRRQELERDFARNLAIRRDEANRAVAKREQAARAQAEQILAEATARAEDTVTQATARVRMLESTRRQVAAEIRTARQALAGALPLVEPLPDEVAIDRTGRAPVMPRQGTAGGAAVFTEAALPLQRGSAPTVPTAM